MKKGKVMVGVHEASLPESDPHYNPEHLYLDLNIKFEDFDGLLGFINDSEITNTGAKQIDPPSVSLIDVVVQSDVTLDQINSRPEFFIFWKEDQDTKTSNKKEKITGLERAKLSQVIKNYGAIPQQVDELMLTLVNATREEAFIAVEQYVLATKGG